MLLSLSWLSCMLPTHMRGYCRQTPCRGAFSDFMCRFSSVHKCLSVLRNRYAVMMTILLITSGMSPPPASKMDPSIGTLTFRCCPLRYLQWTLSLIGEYRLLPPITTTNNERTMDFGGGGRSLSPRSESECMNAVLGMP